MSLPATSGLELARDLWITSGLWTRSCEAQCWGICRIRVPIGFGYVLGRWYLLLEIRYQQKGRSIWDGCIHGNHSDDVLCWVNLGPFGILHVPLLIFPRVVLGGGCGFLDATSLSN
jgi:hypothetical protein